MRTDPITSSTVIALDGNDGYVVLVVLVLGGHQSRQALLRSSCRVRLHGRKPWRTQLIERQQDESRATLTHLMCLELDQVCFNLFVRQREVVFVDEEDLDKVPRLEQLVTRFFASHLDVVHPRRQT